MFHFTDDPTRKMSFSIKRVNSYALLFAIAFGLFLASGSEDYCTKERFEIQREYEDADQVIGPLFFVRHFVSATIQPLEPYVFIQIELEQKADEAKLYQVPPSERQPILDGLYNDSGVLSLIEECEKAHVTPTCSGSLYRTADGTCNNLEHPLWGSAAIPFERFIPAAYNGISGFRKSVNGQDLPNARSISLKLENKTVTSQKVSALYSFYGQTVVHDMTGSPAISRNGTAIECCDPSNTNCRDINISEDDPFYGQFNFTCIPIARTAPYPQCNFEKRNQMNQKTAFIDVSLIYGSDDKEAALMRYNKTSGRLNSRQTDFGELLPEASDERTLFCQINETEKCFLSGDERVNQHTMLMSLQTMYVRLHNNIHDTLIKLNPHWTGDKAYHESRRLVVALQQFMVYSEYLPWLLGTRNMNEYDLWINFYQGSQYDEEMKPNLLNEFSSAAFRLHSMIATNVSKYHPQMKMDFTFAFNCPVHKGDLGSYVTGSSEVLSEKYDRYFVDSVRDYLNRPPGAWFGSDLVAINIQRGRDHGMPVYVDVVEKCSEGSLQIRDFSDLQNTMTSQNADLLQSIYSNVRDIDLWVGMLLEKHYDDSLTGYTAGCILATQFQRVKFGDSFFFTHRNGRYPFTKDQLRVIQSYSVARFLCETTNYSPVRKYPLAAPILWNDQIDCDEFSQLDLSPWKETVASKSHMTSTESQTSEEYTFSTESQTSEEYTFSTESQTSDKDTISTEDYDNRGTTSTDDLTSDYEDRTIVTKTDETSDDNDDDSEDDDGSEDDDDSEDDDGSGDDDNSEDDDDSEDDDNSGGGDDDDSEDEDDSGDDDETSGDSNNDDDDTSEDDDENTISSEF